MQKLLTALFIVAGISLASMPAHAQKAKRKAAAKQPDAIEKISNDGNMRTTDYQCEKGGKLTVINHTTDTSYINLKWGNRIHRMERQPTTTGAHRFENRREGLVLISIPAKSMLLDSKKGRPLVNDCMNAEQRNGLVMAQPVKAKPAAK